MPVAALWSLVICLAGLALGLAYKVAEFTHRVDRLNKEAETLRSELDTLQKSKNKEISDIKELHQREAAELRKELEKLIHDNPLNKFVFRFGVFWDKTGKPYCPDCNSPLLKTSFGVCGKDIDLEDEWMEVFKCSSCTNTRIELRDLNNTPFSLRQAREIILANKGVV
jgi:hypothetical protein